MLQLFNFATENTVIEFGARRAARSRQLPPPAGFNGLGEKWVQAKYAADFKSARIVLNSFVLSSKPAWLMQLTISI